MKRSGEIQRKTPLKAKTPLRSKSGLITRVGIARRKAQSAKRARDTGPSKLVVQLVFDRDGGCCVRCAKGVAFERRGEDWSLQHRRARGRGSDPRPETNLPANLIVLCGSATSAGGCHEHVERHRAEARLNGWSMRWTQDPQKVPLNTWWGPVLLDDKGRWRSVEQCLGCVCDPVLCATDDSGEHCLDQSCGSCLHGCPSPDEDGCAVCAARWTEVPS